VYACLWFNGTSALFRLLVQKLVESKTDETFKNDLKQRVYPVKKDLRLTRSTYRNKVDVDILDKHIIIGLTFAFPC